MSQIPELQTIFKISGVLLKAFEEIHKITGSALANKPAKADKPERVEKSEEKKEKKKERKESQHSETADKKEEKKKVQVVEQAKPEPKPDKKEQLAEKKKEKKKRHPDQPKAPVAAYFRFNNSNLDKIKSQYPNLSQNQLVSISGMLWKKLSEAQKQPFEAEYEKEKKIYDQNMEKFYQKHPELRPKKHHKSE